MGFDNYLRTFIYDDEWQKSSSLILGLETLQLISNNVDMTGVACIMSPAIDMCSSQQFLIKINNENIKKVFSKNKILDNLTKDIF